ncbi:interferon alpha/beta receptor 2 isoform X1 [Mustela putorius furo]|uniref:Interferon alpha/beta receptor 2 n=2 Tax=Mustela putorius furo TaxID=9669 RepID=A0A8U0V7U3_MUSPF|nr:interferon alpha/beta receptor 2 isoform X1 [Mustela putorius furo]XP_044941078.1 interferon alpha/beta receptor 2 isoform X1 [Mustela putorius furo]XP_044941079.1 interferon alpha/beta receptor 2 isoform X1 [Mustela putorius furo]
MLWSQNASPLRSRNLCLVVCISLLSGVLSSLPDLSDKSCTFKVTLHNFRVILSWELKNRSIVPDRYTLQYTVISRPDGVKIVEHCSNITASFCDLTDVWEVLPETYAVMVDGFRGNTTLVTCFTDFFLAAEISLEPPEFDIVNFTDHINVNVNFPPVLPKILEELLQFHLSLIIEEQSGEIVKKHNPALDEHVIGNFTYVIDKLLPNTNYCVSVYFMPRNLEAIRRSPIKCTLLQPARDTGLSESARIGGIITMFLIAAVFISTIIILKRVGYICLRNNFPKVLNFNNLSAWVVPEMPPWEAVAFVEVIHINRKKKEWNYNYDDESDSNDEATAPLTSTGGYTKHGLLTGLPGPTSASSPTGQDCLELDTEEPNLSEPKGEPPMAPEPSLGRGKLLQDCFFEDGSSTEEAGDKIVFNVNLSSVFVSTLDDDVSTLDDDSDVPPVLPSFPEEDSHTPEPSFLATSREGTQQPFPTPSAECPWPEDVLSDKRDSSEPNVDIGDGYIMR